MKVASFLHKMGRAPRYAVRLLLYLWYHKIRFGISHTKFDISFCVFRESFCNDQYLINTFIRALEPSQDVFFLDIGRNHGFVLYYALHTAQRSHSPIRNIDYVGIDPAPLKFVYYRKPLPGITVNYRLINKAVVFDEQKTVRLKYGENNFGNFNVSGSNYAAKLARSQARFQFIDIEVDTISADGLIQMVREQPASSAIIIKIDCKNRTEHLMELVLDAVKDRSAPYLVACEADGSSCMNLSHLAGPDGSSTRVASNVLGRFR